MYSLFFFALSKKTFFVLFDRPGESDDKMNYPSYSCANSCDVLFSVPFCTTHVCLLYKKYAILLKERYRSMSLHKKPGVKNSNAIAMVYCKRSGDMNINNIKR